MNWQELETETVIKKLESNQYGLTNQEASNRLEKYGFNELTEKAKPSNIYKFLMQFTEPLTVLLIIAGIVSLVIHDIIDAAVIFFVVILNAILGYRQEAKAENAMEKLKSMTHKSCVVLRENIPQQVDVREITLGDIIILEEGDSVPADLRLIESYDLKVNESSLTGESLPVTKSHNANEDNLVYMNTNITRGHAKAVVTDIAMDTKIGLIASSLQEEEDEDTPLEIKLDKLGKMLGLLSIVICIIIFVLELLQGIPAANTFMTAVSLAVAAIPEGLPAILTLTLALGMQKMAANNVIIRRLLAVETLGSCSIICTDKTGTLTLNKLKVTDSYNSNHKMSNVICSKCNNASIDNDEKIGDPTDISLLEYSEENIEEDIKAERLYEIPLDSQRKRMTTVNVIDNKQYVLVKGAPEILLDKCKYIDEDGNIKQLDVDKKEEIANKIKTFTNNALRVLLLAYKTVDDYTSYDNEQLEESLIFTGIVGMMDPPREGVADAIETCHNAGINVKMITGDHKNTAMAIAKQVGIKNNTEALTGREIEKLSDEEFENKIRDVNIFARVFPEQKLRIVKALKHIDQTVAMTGDGVNDAPALKSADIGVSMGSGTDVAKESSDMVLQDDNFTTIIYAVKEGRTIYSNIKRFIKFQLSTNIAAILTILISSLASLPLPFNPVQLLWINIIMDGPPAQSLGVEASDKDIMNIPPSDENILSKDNLLHIFLMGIVMATGTLGVYVYELSTGTSTLLASSIAFTVFVMYQLFNVFNCRANSGKTNKTLVLAVTASFILQLFAIYTPILQPIFKTTSIPLIDWVLIIIVALTIFIAEKIIKKFENNII
ncbi:MAG: calcium-translocating P-type ATPase, PMCA-type [Methanosphaera stadtmanae]|jgi:Ca2+-transporting ATPase|nr:calcium-translocating P-type ATPase, PMCA-type [Methanosphaera stadtmanae]